MENVIVVFPKLEDAKKIRNLLVRNGIDVDAACASGAQALEYAHSLNGGIVICSYRFTDMYYTQLREDLPSTFDVLLVAGEAHWPEESDETLVKLSLPLKLHDLLNTVHMMFEAQARRRRNKRSGPRVRSEEEQATLREAKGLLMERNHMTEAEAHKYLQKCSMDSGSDIVETARMVLCLYRD